LNTIVNLYKKVKETAEMKESETNQTVESRAVVYPQPANTYLVVNANFAVVNYCVNPIIGETSLNKIVKGLSFFTIDLTSLSIGVYALILNGKNNEIYEILFAKN
jgi:hypothetical protein